MNWKEIKEKYPKSINRVLKYFDLDVDDFNIDWFGLTFTNRNLYDFFDENEIYVESSSYVDVFTNKVKYRCGIDQYITDGLTSMSAYGLLGGGTDKPNFIGNTRKEAETPAFEKAFEILEGKLK